MPKFYCDYSDTYLPHDSPSVRKTHCSGRKHKENVKDYYQKWMEKQAQSLIDRTTAAFQQGKLPPAPFSAPSPAGAMIPLPPSLPGSSAPWHDACTPHGRPSYDANDGSTASWDDACGTGSHGWPHAHDAGGPPMVRPPARPMMVSTRPDMTLPDR
ncbi:U1 small nuclear ribonucleoprotein C [Sigmodon hispidus]